TRARVAHDARQERAPKIRSRRPAADRRRSRGAELLEIPHGYSSSFRAPPPRRSTAGLGPESWVALLGRARIDQVVLDVRARAARRAVIRPVARKDDAAPVRRRGRVRLAAVAPGARVGHSVEGAVLVGESLDRLAPVQLHRDDLGAEALAILYLVVDVR